MSSREGVQPFVNGFLIFIYTVLPASGGFALPILVEGLLKNEAYPPIRPVSIIASIAFGLLGLAKGVSRVIRESPKI